jgi:hypothetical protein
MCAERAAMPRVVEARRRGMMFFRRVLEGMGVLCRNARAVWRISVVMLMPGWRVLGAVRVLEVGCWEGFG